MPVGKRDAIHAQVSTMRALGLHRDQIAEKIQDIWPGCTGNHVRGVIAGLASKAAGGRSGSGSGTKRHIMRAGPWTPGTPRPRKEQA